MNQARRVVKFVPDTRPTLLTIVHTEEEFDWSKPFDPKSNAVTHLSELGRAHEIFERHGARAAYMIDYPVASDTTAVAALNGLASQGRAMIGAHLHPWVNPPFGESVSNYNSYPGNLPGPLPCQENIAFVSQRECEKGNGHRRSSMTRVGSIVVQATRQL